MYFLGFRPGKVLQQDMTNWKCLVRAGKFAWETGHLRILVMICCKIGLCWNQCLRINISRPCDPAKPTETLFLMAKPRSLFLISGNSRLWSIYTFLQLTDNTFAEVLPADGETERPEGGDSHEWESRWIYFWLCKSDQNMKI